MASAEKKVVSIAQAQPSRLEAVEERLRVKAAAKKAAADDQLAIDKEAYETLLDEYSALATVRVPRHVEGHPMLAIVCTPSPDDYKRFKQRVQRATMSEKRNAAEIADAGEQLARRCWVYPKEPEAREGMLATFPGILTSIANAATALAQGAEQDEGKE